MPDRPPLDCAVLSHKGMVRAHNEDSVFVDASAGIAVLADGMGGYNAGEVASGIAVNVVSSGMLPELRSDRELSKVDIASGLTHAALLLQQKIAVANKGIYEAAQARPECAGMGTKSCEPKRSSKEFHNGAGRSYWEFSVRAKWRMRMKLPPAANNRRSPT